ncbi:MAG: tRNA (cytidine(34)-2'-O)-methyltransferase [Candidatus Rifleibacteriota bacterium]
MARQKHKIDNTDAEITVVLLHPDIPQNTGNIARLCFATGCQLVLVRPLGFRLTDSGLERAGMDYWKSLEPKILDDIEEFIEWSKGKKVYYLSAHGDKNYAQISYKKGDILVFGSESSGLPAEILDRPGIKDKMISLPMIPEARCINVSSAASAVVYEALRQIYNWSSSDE